MNRNEYARWRSYQKTLMAVYWLAEPDGLRCHATWRELAAEVGLCVDTVKAYVRDLEKARVIRIPRVRDRGHRRTIVLLDHPDAAEYLRALESRGRGSTSKISQDRR